MTKAALTLSLHLGSSPKNDTLTDKLNRRVLQTIHELAAQVVEDPSSEDECQYALFGRAGSIVTPAKAKKK